MVPLRDGFRYGALGKVEIPVITKVVCVHFIRELMQKMGM